MSVFRLGKTSIRIFCRSSSILISREVIAVPCPFVDLIEEGDRIVEKVGGVKFERIDNHLIILILSTKYKSIIAQENAPTFVFNICILDN